MFKEVVSTLSKYPRMVGSKGEIAGIKYCKDVFRNIGINLKEDIFYATKFWMNICPILNMISLILLSFLLLFVLDSVNIILLFLLIIVNTVLYFLYVKSIKPIKIGKKVLTKNLIGEITARAKTKRHAKARWLSPDDRPGGHDATSDRVL